MMSDDKIRVCSVVGERVDVLPHFIRHYKAMGLDSFHIIIHGKTNDDPVITQAKNMLDGYNLKPEKIYIGPWHENTNKILIQNVKDKHPNDWFIVADQDELQVYPDEIKKIVQSLSRRDITYISGFFLDRVSADGRLSPINGTSIWEQYPLAGFVSFTLSRANPYKITLCRGSVELAEGQHGVIEPGEDFPLTNELICQVHHFKWTGGLYDRIQERMQKFSQNIWETTYHGLTDEFLCQLNYLRSNGNKINTLDQNFLFIRAADQYGDYRHWNKLKGALENWQSLQNMTSYKEKLLTPKIMNAGPALIF